MWTAQLCLDVMVSVLNDSKIMGKDVFGAKRLMRIGDAFNRKFSEYIVAMSDHEEADYLRTKIDQEQAMIFGSEAKSWSERYDYFDD